MSRCLTNHRELEIPLHLFIQPGSGAEAVYIGTVHVEHIQGDEPMNVTFTFEHVPTQPVLTYLDVKL